MKNDFYNIFLSLLYSNENTKKLIKKLSSSALIYIQEYSTSKMVQSIKNQFCTAYIQKQQ